MRLKPHNHINPLTFSTAAWPFEGALPLPLRTALVLPLSMGMGLDLVAFFASASALTLALALALVFFAFFSGLHLARGEAGASLRGGAWW